MESTQLDFLYHWFDGYVKTFYTDDPEIHPRILQKEEHTLLVAKHCKDLAQSLGLSGPDLLMAEAVGLCHDVGRFKQVTLYRTFKDHDSVNHGLFGVEQLKAEGIDRQLAPEDWDLLAFVVAWHNAAILPPHPDKSYLTFARIARDADKLDIYRVLPPQPPADGCSPELIADMLAGKLLYYDDIKKPDDRKLIMASWIYDVNFPWTIREIGRRGYIDRLFAAMPPSPPLTVIQNRICEHMAALSNRL